MSMASTPPALTMGTATYSWSGSTCTTTRPPVASTCPGPCSWIWSPAPWTPCARGPSGRFSGRTISSLARVVLATTGPRGTTRRARSWWTRCWTSCGRRPRAATACRASSSPTHWAGGPGLGWGPSSSARSGRSTQTGS
ncbi:hypothetical protein HJG60_009633 [Phyllostomus discolor]|uniref:Uncharacterized protein n=1 Tax=Phyllostomus discolor TaxID=89673 RepID=A0A834B6D8_9CHIR|nr:hypothetical protein HJG60_009633 [Phyllostomus discolor]